jgi:general stress protein YciG
MAGTKEGARKAHETKIKKDPDFYRKIGRLSWKNDRSHAVGFGLMDAEKRRELGQKGGKKTKKDYKKEERVHEDVGLATDDSE